MNEIAIFTAWLSCIAVIIHHVASQSGVAFRVVDSETLVLDDDAYCIRSVTVRAYLTNDTYDGESPPAMRLAIAWDSDHNVTSLTVVSDSVNDTYCDSQDRFAYHRKPAKKNMHTFPDLVNHGPRYLPIKLDCKYTIIPDVSHACMPVYFKYSVPACLSDTVCSCRNASMPEPRLRYRHQSKGVVVHWDMPRNAPSEEIRRMYITVEVSQFIPPFSPDFEFVTDDWDRESIAGGSHFFELNTTQSRSYTVKGFYENAFECVGNVTQLTFNFPDRKRESMQILLYLIFYALTITLLMLVVFYFFRRKLGQILCNKLLYTETTRPVPIVDVKETMFPNTLLRNNPIYALDIYDSNYIVDYNRLVFKRKLAEGNFGVVYLATSSVDIRGHKEFAVKQLKDSASRDDFLEEMKTFERAGAHPNIVRMIGCCKDPQPLSIIMEYVPFNLLEYLKNLRDEFEMRRARKIIKAPERSWRRYPDPLPVNYIRNHEVESTPLTGHKQLEYVLDHQELESFGLQIARGMAHLEKSGIVHRDLAARNILVDEFKTLKVSDFGMSRTGVYVNQTNPNRKFPLRWMSPEAITKRVFSNKSDVWSYGIVLWEIGTLGGFPYPDLQNDQVLALLKKGGHPERPECVTLPLYHLMLRCWSFEPEERPDFSDIVEKIESLRQKAYVDFASLREYYVFPPTEEDFGTG